MTADTRQTRSARRRFSGNLAETGIAVIAIVIALVLGIGTLTMHVRGTAQPGPQFFPLLVTGLLLVVGIILLVAQWRRHAAREADWHRPDVSEDLLRDVGANTELLQVDAVAEANEATTTAPAPAVTDPDTAHPFDWRTVGLVVLAVVGFIATLELLGWIIAAAGMFWLIAFAFGSRRRLFDLGVALLISSTVQLLFVAGLGLSLPSGILGVF